MSGRYLTIATVAVCVALVGFALWRRSQGTSGIRQFWGPREAQLIQHAPQVLLRSGSSASDQEIPSLAQTSGWTDVSNAPGLVHLRATLVDDRYYRWPARAALAEETISKSTSSRVLRFVGQNGFVDVGIDPPTGTIVNLVRARAVTVIDSSRQAIAAYLQTEGQIQPHSR